MYQFDTLAKRFTIYCVFLNSYILLFLFQNQTQWTNDNFAYTIYNNSPDSSSFTNFNFVLAVYSSVIFSSFHFLSTAPMLIKSMGRQVNDGRKEGGCGRVEETYIGRTYSTTKKNLQGIDSAPTNVQYTFYIYINFI